MSKARNSHTLTTVVLVAGHSAVLRPLGLFDGN
jgi:hypothetical protein